VAGFARRAARTVGDSYIAVIRSEDEGVTWIVPVDPESEGTDLKVGDGISVHIDGSEDCQIFHDKDMDDGGPRPGGVPLVEGADPGHTSPDRLYVTWTRSDSGPAGDTQRLRATTLRTSSPMPW
jgi:hypothetical protein